MKTWLACSLLLLAPSAVLAQAGTPNVQTGPPVLAYPGNAAGFTDPCLNAGVLKSSVVINITSATTTSLVSAVSGKAVYVCGMSLTISQVATTANTLQLEYGTGGTCGSGTTGMTGTFGSGGVTAASPLFVAMPEVQATPAANGVCAVTTIGASASFEGVLTYVQQ